MIVIPLRKNVVQRSSFVFPTKLFSGLRYKQAFFLQT